MHFTEMPTKYELAAELRALNMGHRALPICRMKKGEIEHHINILKRVKEETDAAGPAPKAKPGPVGPRKVPVIATVMDDVQIKTPVAPSKRPTTKSEAMAAGEAYVKSRKPVNMVMGGDDEEMEAEVRRIVLALKRERAVVDE